MRGELYEFWTDDGLHVDLEAADLLNVTYEPPVLTLEFLQGPLASSGQPRIAVVFRFEDVHIHDWRHELHGHRLAIHNDGVQSGQVDGVYWNGRDYFTVHSHLAQLGVTAARVVVTAQPVS